MIFAAIMAGGSGTRMGGDVPKQYLPLCGKPVLIHTLSVFLKCKIVEKTAVLCPANWVEETERIIGEYLPESAEKIFVTSGGNSRNATLEKSIAFVQERFGAGNGDVLITHDAVRPFVTEKMLSENAEAAKKHGACNTVIPATDTLAVTTDGVFLTDTPDRSLYRHSQTPQSFVIGEAKKCLAALSQEQRDKLTDACMLFTCNGKRVATVQGSQRNIKLTRPVDMLIGELFLHNPE